MKPLTIPKTRVIALVLLGVGVYLFATGKLNNDWIIGIGVFVLLLLWLSASEPVEIDLSDARQATDVLGKKLLRSEELDGKGSFRVLPESEKKKILGQVDDNPAMLTDRFSVLGTVGDDRYYLFEWDRFGKWEGLTEVNVSDSIKRFGKTMTILPEKPVPQPPPKKEVERDES